MTHKQKLTLTVDATTIAEAKRYAKAHNTSLSHLVEKQLAALVLRDNSLLSEDLSPWVASMHGAFGSDSEDLSKAAIREQMNREREAKHQ